MIEMLVGVVFAAIVLSLPYLHERIREGEGMKLKLPKISFLKKEVEEKLQEVDKKLEEVVSAGVSRKKEGENEGMEENAGEKIVPLEDAVKTVQVDDNLLEEMETGNLLKAGGEEGVSEENKLPDIPELPELNGDIDVDVGDIEDEIKLESDDMEGEEDEDIEEVEFDEEDDLISSIAKEVEVKEEEEVDLLRDLKGQKIAAEELEKELQETIQKLKAIAGVE